MLTCITFNNFYKKSFWVGWKYYFRFIFIKYKKTYVTNVFKPFPSSISSDNENEIKEFLNEIFQMELEFHIVKKAPEIDLITSQTP